MTTITATLKDGRTVEYLPTQIGEGGMKRVYFTADKQSVVCFFKDAAAAKDPSRHSRLEAVLGRNNPTTDSVYGDYFRELFCWPTGIAVQPEFGIVTPTYPSNFFFSSGNWTGKQKVGRWFASPKLRKLLPPEERGNWLNYLQICVLMARAVRKMHAGGFAHSDLSSNNILVDPKSGRCVVIDIDSLVVPGLYPPDVLGTPGYIAPEVLQTSGLPLGDPQRVLPSLFTDLHALPVLMYEYLLRRHPLRGPKVHSTASAEEDEFLAMGERALFVEDPNDNSNQPKSGFTVPYESMGPYLVEVFRKAFVDGLHEPRARAAAGTIERALCRTMDILIPCGNSQCEEKWFVYLEGQRPKCPWCGWKLNESIPVLDFNYAPRKGQFISERHCLVGFDQRPINKWHTNRHIQPTEGVDKESVAYVAKYQGQWIIINKHMDSMISPGGNPVPKGQACPIKEGDEVLMTKEDDGRLFTVRMIPC